MNDEKKLKLSSHLRKIGDNFNSVSLLHIASTYVSNNLGKMTLDPECVDFTQLDQILQPHRNLNGLICDIGMRNIHTLKPALDGKAIQTIYNIKAGKHVKDLMEECIKFQILNPDSPYEQI